MTDVTEVLQAAGGLLAAQSKETRTPEANRLDAVIDAEKLLPAIETLLAARWGYLSAITGLDVGEGLEVLYHFCQGAAIVTLRVSLTRTEASVPSICPLIPSAIMFERELAEMLGIEVVGLPDLGYLFLPDDWPAGLYPLRKDADLTPVTGQVQKEGEDA